MTFSTVRKHFVDFQGNKFVVDFNQVYGEMITQVHLNNGQSFYACDGETGLFDQVMDSLGMIKTLKGIDNHIVFYFPYDSMHAGKFQSEITSIFEWIKSENDLFSKPANVYTLTPIVNGHFDFNNKKTVINDYDSLFK
jgi:hypothetical protein